jgi:antitoxin (DNA-binding transcriptional repressor) of toxin-antitoxin stability system
MTTHIAQRDVRNDTANILRRVEAGEDFVVTATEPPSRSCVRPLVAARCLGNDSPRHSKGVPGVVLSRLRADQDEIADPTLHDPWAGG